MTLRIPITLSLFSLSIAGFAQSIPYHQIKTLDDCAKELRQIEGITTEVKLEHSNPKDTRDFQLWLETPGDRKIITMGKDGTFRLPDLSPDNQEQARVTHSLEKGALALSLALDWNGKVPIETESQNVSLFARCSMLTNEFSKIEPVFVKMGDAFPYFKDFQIAIVGVSVARESPCSGLAILKNVEKTVATIDLSQTGKASWMFSDYDPRSHRVVFEMNNGDPEPKLLMEIKSGNEAAQAKCAILLRNPK